MEDMEATEVTKSCNDTEFTCGDGSCISIDRVCDQIYDCFSDFLDEQNCISKFMNQSLQLKIDFLSNLLAMNLFV